MNYSKFTLADLLSDPYFCEWAATPTPATNLFWQTWLMEHPEKKELITQAQLIVRSIDFEKTPEAEIDDEKILYRIKATLQKDREKALEIPASQDKPNTNPEAHRSFASKQAFLGRWTSLAAAFVGTLFVASIVYFFITQYQNTAVSYRTAYGETKTVVLPDSSEILLNGNSSLRFSANWQTEKTREVWLTGEAYFHVQEIAQRQGIAPTSDNPDNDNLIKFVVHTDALDVEVVGTQFNVNTRREKTEVVLSSGKVRLKIEDQDELVMEPGEMVGYSQQDHQIVRKVVNPEVYASWKNNHLIFDEVPLQKVAEILKDTYGIEVVFEDEQLSEKVLKGVFPSDNVDVLLAALSDIYHIRISKTERKIIFHKE